MILNLFFIRNTNGLFYYALDYYKSLRSEVDFILVNESILAEVERKFEGARVKKATLIQFINICFSAFKEKIFIFTPSSHPIPFISKQLVVVHDPYPFYGGTVQAIKRLLLRISLSSSNCYVGHINISNSLPLIKKFKISERRIIFMPNKLDVFARLRGGRREGNNNIRIGLVGTDSRKKRYEFLFKEALLRKEIGAYKFVLYGHLNSYASNLLREFNLLDIEINCSDQISLQEFFENVDIIVSVAIDEGFGRPIAAALGGGIPCYLIDTPVFREFYSGSAFMYDDIPRLLDGIICRGKDVVNDQIVYNIPPNIAMAIESSSRKIKTLLQY